MARSNKNPRTFSVNDLIEETRENQSEIVMQEAAMRDAMADFDEPADEDDEVIESTHMEPIRDNKGRTPSVEKVAASKAKAAAKEAKIKVAKEPKVKLPTYCQCGCGGQTAGGKFLPGHDAKLKSRLQAKYRSDNAIERDAAFAELQERGWAHFATLGKQKAATKTATKMERINALVAEANTNGPTLVIIETLAGMLGWVAPAEEADSDEAVAAD